MFPLTFNQLGTNSLNMLLYDALLLMSTLVEDSLCCTYTTQSILLTGQK